MLCKNAYIMHRIVLMVLLALALVISSCKKSPQSAPPEPSQQAAQLDTNAAIETKPAVQPEIEATAEEKPAAAQPASAGRLTAGDLEPIPLVLPKPMFVGTPQSFRGITNLEKPLGKPRPPFYAPKGTTNVALGKPVTSSDEQPIIGEIKMITDGDKEAADGSYVELGPFKQYITIDLSAPHNIYAIVVWHYHKQARVYKDVVVQVADDPDFITNVRTVFNNDNDNSSGLGVGSNMNYVETAEGKLIDAKGVVARYVRCYSNANTSNDLNNYIEVEVYGLP
ncbi:MAG: hypothetical protein ABII09_02570 [Planctomycetota bacterium]